MNPISVLKNYPPGKQSGFQRNRIHLQNTFFAVPSSHGYEHLWREFSSRSGFETGTGNRNSGIKCRIDTDLVIHPNKKINQEAYRVEFKEDEILLRSPHIEGLWRGIHAVASNLRISPGQKLHCGWLENWPSISLRGAHLDLAFVMYTPEFLMSLLPMFSAMSINTILLDISDKLIFPKLESIRHPDALPVEFWRNFEAEAQRWFIEIIPVVQTFGHMGNYLKHEELKPLREIPDSSGTICPSNGKSLEFLETLIAGVKQAFPESRTIHAGLDEVGYSGQCPRCRRRYARLGYGGIYLEHIKKIHEILDAQKARMMMWADILIAYPEVCDELPRNIIINDWQYTRYAIHEKSWFVFTGMKTPGMQANGTKEELKDKFPEGLLPAYEKYLWSGKRNPPFNAYPYLRYFMDKGFDVVGSPAVKCVGSQFLTPMYDRRLPNILSFTEELTESRAMGVINTNWSARGTHLLSASIPGYWAGALAAWNGKSSMEAIDKCLASWFLPGHETIMREYIILGQNISPLTKYGWSDKPEHFDIIRPDKFQMFEKEFHAMSAGDKRRLIRKHGKIAFSAKRLISASRHMACGRIRAEVKFACKMTLLKLREERLLVKPGSQRDIRILLKDLQVMRNNAGRIFGGTLSPSSLNALIRVLFAGSLLHWGKKLE